MAAPARERRCRCSSPRSTTTATSAPAFACPTSRCRSRPTPAGISATRRSARPAISSRCSARRFRFRSPRAARAAAKDPRRSIEERYPTRDDYIEQVRAAADALVLKGYLLVRRRRRGSCSGRRTIGTTSSGVDSLAVRAVAEAGLKPASEDRLMLRGLTEPSNPTEEPPRRDSRPRQLRDWRKLPIPTAGDGDVLRRTIYLSLDPYMRGRMSDAPSYAATLAIGDVMCGHTVSQVVESRNPGFQRRRSRRRLRRLAGVRRVERQGSAQARPEGPADFDGHRRPRHAGHDGVRRPARHRPAESRRDRRRVGRVGRGGRVVGQLAKIKGCRAVGIAGSPDKCRYVVDELGFDACMNYKTDDLVPALRAACPDGVDIYFENVGGAVFAAVLQSPQPRRPHPAVRDDFGVQRDRRIPAGPTCGRCSSTAR